MPKLNQIIAVEKGLKGRTVKEVTAIHHKLQKPDLFSGLSRTYTPSDDEGEQLPSESKRVQLITGAQLQEAAGQLTQLFDVTATKEWGNTGAVADVKVGDEVIVFGAPVTYLLFLEKQLTDWRTLVSKLPLLDPELEWSEDDNVAGQYRTAPVQTTRSKKVPRNHVKAEATDKHPAQVEVYFEDVIVGRWTLVKFSGAVSQKRRDELVERTDVLLDAVKRAREEANGIDVSQVKVADAVFAHLLA